MNMVERLNVNRSGSQSQSLMSCLIYRNRAVLALQAASVFFLFVFLSLRVNLSGFSISFLSLNLGRTHMFILCNGIVAILVKGSVLAAPEEEKPERCVQEKPVKTEALVEEEDRNDENVCVLVAETQQVDDDDQKLIQEEEEELQSNGEEGEGGFEEELSVEELNKKCDEFIRKMRGVICKGN